MPRRFAVAPENDMYDREVRVLSFKSGQTTYRALYTIFEALESNDADTSEVCILHVRHGAARPLQPETED